MFGAAIAVAWRRCDHPPLKYLAAAALATSTLVQLEQRTFTRHAPYPHPLVNWLAYDFLLPAAAALAATIAVGRLEVARLRDVERRTFGPRPAAAGVLSLCAIVLAFGWLNLAILNFFGEAPQFRIAPVRVPERDLTVSIAWALYALMLLGLGVQRRLSGLRWASLMLLIATIGKVFLFDLGNLGGLYRVASLLGLALSLLFVSLLYQRFVFRRPAADPASP